MSEGKEGQATYRWAGVDIEAGAESVESIREAVESTYRPEVISGLGGFGGLFRFDPKDYEDPVLVSGADGVGTKIEIARMLNKHDTVGIDLVAMCADDVAVTGAEPLFLQDYIATGKVVPERIREIVEGIATGCREAGCSLVGGEIAEHPGVMEPDQYDLAGFAVGVVERDEIIDGSSIEVEDAVIGVHSSGLHSNGYSLARKLLFEDGGFNLDDHPKELGWPLGRELLVPSRIYTPLILKARKTLTLKGLAHITGGGLIENVARILPADKDARIWPGSWPVRNIFTFLQKVGDIDLFEMLRTFNMGIGLVMVIPPSEIRDAVRLVEENLYKASRIGEVTEGTGNVRFN